MRAHAHAHTHTHSYTYPIIPTPQGVKSGSEQPVVNCDFEKLLNFTKYKPFTKYNANETMYLKHLVLINGSQYHSLSAPLSARFIGSTQEIYIHRVNHL